MSPSRFQLLRVAVDNQTHLQRLIELADADRDVEIWSDAPWIGTLTVRIPERRRATLDSLGLQSEVVISDMSQYWASLSALATGPGFFDGVRTYEEHVDFMAVIAAEHPKHATMIDLGMSVQGRTMWALRIAGLEADGAPTVLYHGAQHGDETMGAAVIAYLAQHLVTNYDADPTIHHLVDNVTWYLLPIMNPDGYQEGSRYNANRVDLNRNWGGPGSPANAFSQPETAALRDFLSQHSEVRAYVDLHSCCHMILWPWGHTATPCQDNDTYTLLGTRMAEKIQEFRGTYYSQRGPIYTTIYPVSGGSLDYTYGVLGHWSFAFEIPSPYPSEIVPVSQELTSALAFLASWVYDCNENGYADQVDISVGTVEDCNSNRTPDECEIQRDFDLDGAIDVCDSDIDNDGVPNDSDVCDLTVSGSPIDGKGRPVADTNQNCEVGFSDYWRFRNCLVNGRLGMPAPHEACLAAFDADSDTKVTLRDFAFFQRAFSSAAP